LIFLLAFAEPDTQAKFEYLYSKYKNLMFHKAWEIVHDYMLAEDCVSEAYIRIYRNMYKLEDADSPKTIAFMVTVARNVAISMIQKRKTETPDELDEARPDDFNLESTVLSEMNAQRIYAMMGSLDEQSRNIFMMKFAYDMPHREIAEQLGITENNVNVKLHRAKKKIAAMLRKEG